MIDMTEVNGEAVREELRRLVARYEHALISNDVQALQAFFWPSELALRFGATEELYGATAIDHFRQQRVIDFSERSTLRQEIVTFGADLGVATVEFSTKVEGMRRHGRQSQVWVRFAELGWRIVSAHVSHKVEAARGASVEAAQVDALATLQKLPLDPAFADEVRRQLCSIAAVAEPLMAIDLSDSTEPAPEFRP